MLLPSLDKCVGVLASLALFGAAVATKGWKFSVAPVDGEPPVTFNSAFIMLRPPQGEGDLEKVTLQDQGSNVFVLERALEGETEMVEKLTFVSGLSGILFLEPSRLNLEKAPEEDGYRVVKVEYLRSELVDPGCVLM